MKLRQVRTLGEKNMNNSSFVDRFIASPPSVLAVLVVVVFMAILLPAKAFNQEARLNVEVSGLEAKVIAEGEECSLISSFYDGSYRSNVTENISGTKEMNVNTSKAGDYVFTLRCPSFVGDPQVIVKNITSVKQGLVMSAK